MQVCWFAVLCRGPRLCVVSSWLAPPELPSLSTSGVLLKQNHGLRKKDQFGVDGMPVLYVRFAYTGRYLFEVG